MRFVMWRCSILLLLFTFASTALVATGCRKAPRKQGALSIPTDGNVRIVSSKVEEAPGGLHWKWSVIGERNWREAKVSGLAASLTKTYALNDATERGGCNIWETDFNIADGRWTLIVHGSDGTTAKGEGTLTDPGADASKSVEINQQDDRLTSLPADLTLATVEGKPLTLHIER